MSFKFLPREPHRSPTQFIRTSRKGFNFQEISTKFVPFVQERDGMGRLIKSKQMLQAQSPQILHKKQITNGTLPTELSHNPSKPQLQIQQKIDQVQENINRQFQYKCVQDMKIFTKNKIKIRKNSLQIPFRKHSDDEICLPLIKQPIGEQNESIKRRKGSEVTAHTEPQSPLLRKNSSLVQVRSIRKTSFNDVQQFHHEAICSRSPEKSLKEKIQQRKSKIILQYIQHQSEDPNIIIPEKYLTNKIQNRQINELNRYNTFKTLSLKLTNNLDQGHNIFINKMRETKKLAYKLKLNLEST